LWWRLNVVVAVAIAIAIAIAVAIAVERRRKVLMSKGCGRFRLVWVFIVVVW
jgi:hypothetical protein